MVFYIDFKFEKYPLENNDKAYIMKTIVNNHAGIINKAPNKKEGDETSPEHLSWMLNEMLQMRVGGDKFCRWLGFVHCAMFENGIINISESDPFRDMVIIKNLEQKHLQPEPIKSLVTRYLDIIQFQADSKKQKTKIEINHAKKMIEEMIVMNFDEPLFHLHLGFIQCFMVMNGFVTVNNEREQTRSLF